MGDVLDVRGVTVTREGRNILEDVNWGVDEGERWVVLGPNGAGKTTLIRLIAGRLYPTQGSVQIIGERLGHTNLADLHPLVGLASSALDQRIYDSERVFNVVRTASYGQVGAWRERYDDLDDARARDLLAALGVGGLASRRWGTLSSGERKRVAIARALMPDPEVLVLDEPTEGLDLGGRERVLRALTTLAQGDFSPVMVLVTHHVEEIPQGFTHGLLLKEGRIAAAGPLDEVLTSQTLSAVFDVDVELAKAGGRYSAVARVR